MRKRPIIQYEEPPKVRFCPLCGSENEGAAKKCARCGTTLTPTKGAAFGVADDAGLSQISYAPEENPFAAGTKSRARGRSKGGGRVRTGRGGDAPAMGPIEAFGSCMAKYGDMSGRASRSELWWFNLDVSFITFGWIIVVVMIAAACGVKPEAQPGIVKWLIRAPFFFFFLPSLCVFVRRMHDRGESGLTLVFVMTLPIIIIIVRIFLQLNGGIWGLITAISLIMGPGYGILVSWFPGKRGPNQFDK